MNPLQIPKPIQTTNQGLLILEGQTHREPCFELTTR